MNVTNLRTYIEDHLAGSVGALELLGDLIEDDPEGEWAAEFVAIRDEIAQDREVLKGALKSLDAEVSTVKQAGAWMAQKVMRTKLRTKTPLGLLEALEMLTLGIEGRVRLWKALGVVDLGLPIAELEAGAVDHVHRVERLRVEAARRAFA